jgi:hypothetical protein
MIPPECFEGQCILKKASEIGCRNPVMLEKSINALELLGSIAFTELICHPPPCPWQISGGGVNRSV